jgi:hypothetical protein
MKHATTQKQISLTDWFNGTEELLKLGFTENEIEKAIIDSGNDVNSLTDIQGFQSFPQFLKRAELVDANYSYTKTTHIIQQGKDFEARERVKGIGVRVPANYQGLKHGKILFALFSKKWSWFASFNKTETCEIKKYLSDMPMSQIPEEFKHLTPQQLRSEYLLEQELSECSLWEIYEMHNDAELYLNTDNGSLYVPIKALINSDFFIIEERMKSYWSSYLGVCGFALNHRGRSEDQYKNDQQEAYNKAMSALQSPQAKQLKKYLSIKYQ